jgi:hypothetical protein
MGVAVAPLCTLQLLKSIRAPSHPMFTLRSPCISSAMPTANDLSSRVGPQSGMSSRGSALHMLALVRACLCRHSSASLEIVYIQSTIRSVHSTKYCMRNFILTVISAIIIVLCGAGDFVTVRSQRPPSAKKSCLDSKFLEYTTT